jgi:hypothetical protein
MPGHVSFSEISTGGERSTPSKGVWGYGENPEPHL